MENTAGGPDQGAGVSRPGGGETRRSADRRRRSGLEVSLARLQRLVRQPLPPGVRTVGSRRLPVELTGGEWKHVGLSEDEFREIEGVKRAVMANFAFEHLREVDDDVWYFVGQCVTDRSHDHVAEFVACHGRSVEERTCFIPVEYLKVLKATSLHGIQLLPLDEASIPEPGGWFKLEQPTSSVAAVPVQGTNLGLMAERARKSADHELRILRIALRASMALRDEQLRFRLGENYDFDERLSGRAAPHDIAYDLVLSDEYLTLAATQPVFSVANQPVTDVERKATIALEWMERARMTDDWLVALLYLFFALEALLGRKSEDLKAHDLAFRQVMLGHVTEGNFSHPNETWFLYDQVRSDAVHGEDVAHVNSEVVQSYEWTVRRTLNQYLGLAKERRFAKRGKLLTYLDEHPDRSKLIAWLRTNGGNQWDTYLAQLEQGGSAEKTP